MKIVKESSYNHTLEAVFGQMVYKIVVLKNFGKFTRKHLCWSLFLIKLQAEDTGARFYFLIKLEPDEICKIQKRTSVPEYIF